MADSAAAQGLALDLDWPGVERIVSSLAEQIGPGGVPDVVIGVLRGGMLPAVMLAHQLGVRAVRGITITRTLSDDVDAVKLPVPDVTTPATIGVLTGLDVMLVDDVAGSGLSLAAAAGQIRRCGPSRLRQAVTVVNVLNWSDARPPEGVLDHIGVTCRGWVRFPWERQ